jgi:Glucose-regulated metallo-peptidase M90
MSLRNQESLGERKGLSNVYRMMSFLLHLSLVGLFPQLGIGLISHDADLAVPKQASPQMLLISSVTEHEEPITRATAHTEQVIEGWTVKVNRQLAQQDAVALEKALGLLRAQLSEILRVVPAKAVAEMQKVPLWINPEYPDIPPRAEYHPGAGWLSDHGRESAMAKGVEFTNVRVFEAETRRMPNFALHELAHAFHDRVLGFENAEIEAAYQRAKASGSYDHVSRQDAEGRRLPAKAYAMTNAKEYFAECSEAFFTKNDFFPFTRDELKTHDPEMFALLGRLWDRP